MAEQTLISALYKCWRCRKSFSETFSLEQHLLACHTIKLTCFMKLKNGQVFKLGISYHYTIDVLYI